MWDHHYQILLFFGWVFIFLFLIFFFFFGKNVLECASLLLEPCFAGKGGARNHVSLPISEALQQPQVDLCADLRFWSHCSSCKRKPEGAQKQGPPGPLPSPQPSSAFSAVLLVCFQLHFDFFGGCFSHKTRLSPDLYCKKRAGVRARGSQRGAGTGEAGERANSGLRRRRKVKALF